MLGDNYNLPLKPDKWTIVKLPDNNGYKVLAQWSGGYTQGDSWKLNSGIVKVTTETNMVGDRENRYYLFHGYSKSVYKCNKEMYGVTSALALGVLQKLIDNGCEQVPEERLEEIFAEINKD